MNFLLDAEAIAELTASRGQLRAHLEALVAHEPPYGVAYRRLQAICPHRWDANTLFWRWVVDDTGGQRVIREIEAGAEIEEIHASIGMRLCLSAVKGEAALKPPTVCLLIPGWPTKEQEERWLNPPPSGSSPWSRLWSWAVASRDGHPALIAGIFRRGAIATIGLG